MSNIPALARQLHALLRNGKVRAYADGEAQRFYELVVARWLDGAGREAAMVLRSALEPLHEVECPSCGTTIRARMADAEIDLARCGLTARQVEVLGLVIRQGLSNKDIASRLSLSYRTVEKHLEAILRKTATRSRHELLARVRVPPSDSSGSAGAVKESVIPGA